MVKLVTPVVIPEILPFIPILPPYYKHSNILTEGTIKLYVSNIEIVTKIKEQEKNQPLV